MIFKFQKSKKKNSKLRCAHDFIFSLDGYDIRLFNRVNKKIRTDRKHTAIHGFYILKSLSL